jgi:hypothetical protein
MFFYSLMDIVVGEIVLSRTEIAWYIKTEGDKYSQQTWYFVGSKCLLSY